MIPEEESTAIVFVRFIMRGSKLYNIFINLHDCHIRQIKEVKYSSQYLFEVESCALWYTLIVNIIRVSRYKEPDCLFLRLFALTIFYSISTVSFSLMHGCKRVDWPENNLLPRRRLHNICYIVLTNVSVSYIYILYI